MSRNFLIAFGVGLAVIALAVAGVMFMQRGSAIEIQAKYLKVRTAPLDDTSTVAVMDLRVTNPSNHLLEVRQVTVAFGNQSGGTRYPRADQGWSLEISLDVQVAHAVCPNCKILLVEAKTNSFSNLIAAEDYATTHATVASNSWGGGEFSSETTSSYDGHFDRPGVPITVASGDAGYGVEFPAASRYVTAVGGTKLTLKSDNTRLSEMAWNGSGSGYSSYETKPAWQTDAGCG